MRKTLKKIGFAAIIAVISLAALLMTGCPPDDDDNGGGGTGGGNTPPVSVVVRFNSNGGSSVSDQTITAGTAVSRPSNPTRSSYFFDNWYQDAGFTTPYNFNTPVTANITLYARWISYAEFTAMLAKDMVSIPAGTFMIGSPEAEPNRGGDETQHSVTLSAFKMSKYQVTQEQYQTVIGSNPSSFSSSPEAGETQGKRPVENVSWYDALVFCNKLSTSEGLTPAYSISGKTDPSEWGTVPTGYFDLKKATWDAVVIVAGSTGYRLPTEAQWEYACRAGTTTAYNTGATISDNTGWYNSNSGSKTHEVGKKPANAWGLYDMHGNVWEWCWDWYGSYSSDAQIDPLGASSGVNRMARGGCWGNSPELLRSADRSFSTPYSMGSALGFRLVRP